MNNEIFAYNELLDLVMGDVDIAQSLLHEFKTQTDEHLRILGTYISEIPQTPAIRRDIKKTAHLLKGSALNIRANTFGMLLQTIETNAETAEQASLQQTYTHAQAACQKLYAVISQEVFSGNQQW